MYNILTSVDIDKVEQIMSVYWNLSPNDREKYDAYEKEQECESIVDCMEEYFRSNGLI